MFCDFEHPITELAFQSIIHFPISPNKTQQTSIRQINPHVKTCIIAISLELARVKLSYFV